MQTYYLKPSNRNSATAEMKNSNPTVSNLMLMGKEKQTRMSESTKSYLSPSTFPPTPFSSYQDSNKAAQHRAEHSGLWKSGEECGLHRFTE